MSGRGFPASQHEGPFGKVQPFICVMYGDEKSKTTVKYPRSPVHSSDLLFRFIGDHGRFQVCKHSGSPTWSEYFTFVMKPDQKSIGLKIYSWDM